MTISSIDFTGDFAQQSARVYRPCVIGSPWNGYCVVGVTFTPTAAGTRTGTVTITDDAPGSPRVVALTGDGVIAPFPVFSANQLSFGYQLIGTTSPPWPVTVSNAGSAPFTVTGVSLVSTGDFSQTNTCGGPLGPGSSCTIAVTFSPTTDGVRTGQLTITYDLDGSPHVINLDGLGSYNENPAYLYLKPTSLAFGNVLVGTTSSSQQVYVANPGASMLGLSSITTTPGFLIVTNTCGPTLPNNHSCYVHVAFAPTTVGPRSGYLAFVHSALGSPSLVSLSGNGTLPAPAVTLSPPSLSFGNQALGTTSAPKPVRLTNTGQLPLTISSITTSGNFAQTNNCVSPLAAGAYCTIDVTFTTPPTVAGGQSGTLTIMDNAAGSPHIVALSGVGLGPVAVLSTTTLNFGNRPVGTTSAPRLVNLSNTGNVALTITSITASGDFAQISNCLSFLAGGTYCTLSVTFTPTASGTRTGAITIVDSAAGSPHTVTVSGIGLGPPALTLSKTTLRFADQSLGITSAPQAVTLTNSGSGPLTIASITTSGNYAQTNNCVSPVTAGTYCTINVTFTPVVAGGQSGTLTIVDNAAGSPHTVALNGIGLGPVATLSTPSLNFGNQPVGTTSAPRLVNLSNTGNVPLTITSIVVSGDFAQTNNCVSPLAARTYCTFTVKFAPTAVGTRTGALTVTERALGSPHTVSLTGNGTVPAVMLSPTRLSFGNQPLGTTSAAKLVNLSNTGNAPMTLTSIAASGDFGQTNNCVSPMAARTYCTLSVTFTPTVAGTRTGAITITDNALGSPHMVNLTGIGVSL